MNLNSARQTRYDLLEKPKELLMPMTPVAGADRHAAGYIQGSEYRAGTPGASGKTGT